jgi:hypothetical protein
MSSIQTHWLVPLLNDGAVTVTNPDPRVSSNLRQESASCDVAETAIAL